MKLVKCWRRCEIWNDRDRRFCWSHMIVQPFPWSDRDQQLIEASPNYIEDSEASACRMSHAVTHHHLPLAWYSMRRSANYSSRQDKDKVVDGSRNRWLAVQWANRNILKVQTKINNQSNKKAAEKWLLIVGARLHTPVVSGVPGYRWGYPWIIPLENLRGTSPNDRFRKCIHVLY